jgi:hypothetical protein
MHTGGLTPTAARRLLYGIVAACVALTAGVALLRPAPPAAGPQNPVVILPRLPFAVPAESGSTQVVTVPPDGMWAQSVRMAGVGIPVHGLPGQVGASP